MHQHDDASIVPGYAEWSVDHHHNLERIRKAAEAVGHQPASLKQHQRAQEQEAGVASLAEVDPRHHDERGEEYDGEDDRAIDRQPSGEKAQGRDGNHHQIRQYFEGRRRNGQRAVSRSGYAGAAELIALPECRAVPSGIAHIRCWPWWRRVVRAARRRCIRRDRRFLPDTRSSAPAASRWSG